MFVTSDPSKSMMLVVADTAEEKARWLHFLTDLFLREKLFDLSFLKESLFVAPLRQHGLAIEALSRPSPFSVHGIALPLPLYALIALFVGDLSEVVAMTRVSRAWHESWTLCQPKLLQWLVRAGGIGSWYRWAFWCDQLEITVHGVSTDQLSALAAESSDFNRYEIAKDVNRAFGTSTGKRMIERRSPSAPSPFCSLTLHRQITCSPHG
jgi:hypothetical protein